MIGYWKPQDYKIGAYTSLPYVPDQEVLDKNTPQHNHLLAALPNDVFKRISPHLELIKMPMGKVLYESEDLLQHVYFPTNAIVSLHYVTESGSSAEFANVGNDGALGISLIMGGNTTPSIATVQISGYSYRIRSNLMVEEFNRAGSMMRIMLRYTQAFITQISQTAVCNRHHTIDQQLCRWLLLMLDRLKTNDLTITQQQIADVLGVRRVSITQAINNLQDQGIINCKRGYIAILEKTALERHTCECYEVVKRETCRLIIDSNKFI